MYPDHHQTRSDVQAEPSRYSSDAQAEVPIGLTLDGYCALAGGRGAVIFEPGAAPTLVRDLADLDPTAWIP